MLIVQVPEQTWFAPNTKPAAYALATRAALWLLTETAMEGELGVGRIVSFRQNRIL